VKHLVNILDHDRDWLERLLQRCALLKARRQAGIADRLLLGRALMMFFEKPSTRTRVSLETAIGSMGGYAINQENPAGSRLGDREALCDVARVISRYCDLISVRTFDHQVVETLAAWATVPVINALSDYSHPTQALADLLTIREHLGAEAGRTLVFIGDGNNVARSLAAVAGRFDLRFVLCCPEGYDFDADFVATLGRECPDLEFTTERDPATAVRRADIIYTDVWASMGQEEEADVRRQTFAPYQVN
jgi:ornithine carbamoyltransferase